LLNQSPAAAMEIFAIDRSRSTTPEAGIFYKTDEVFSRPETAEGKTPGGRPVKNNFSRRATNVAIQ